MKKRYRGFICYSRHDKPSAVRLQRWLETYRVPAGVAVEVDASRRLGRFFRDEEDMSATSDIGESVRASMDESECLIVICSPRAPTSKWVEAELRYFLETRGDRELFAFIVDGAPSSGDAATECFPSALRPVPLSNTPAVMPVEPLGLNVRSEGWDRACIRLVAGLLGVKFDDLWQRSRRRRVRQRAVLTVGALALALVMAVLASIATKSRTDSAVRQAELFAREATAASEAGDHVKALQLAVAGYSVTAHGGVGSLGKPPDSPNVLAALEHAYTHNLVVQVFPHAGPLQQIALSSDGEQVATAVDTTVHVWRVGRSAPVSSFSDHKQRVTSIAFSPDGKLLAVADVGSVSLRRLDGGSAPVWKAEFGTVDSLTAVNGNPTTVQFSSRGEYLLAFADNEAALWKPQEGGKPVRTLRTPENINRAVFSPDERLMLFRLSGGDATFWEIGPEKTKFVEAGKTTAMGVSALSNNAQVLTSEGAVVSVWEIDQEKPWTSVDTRAGAVTALAFGPDNWQFATGSANGTAMMWFGGRDTPVVSFVGHTSRISSIVFSSNGQRLLTASTDGTARLWRTNTSEPLRVLNTAGVRVLSVAISADGTKALTGTFAGSARLWSLEDGKPLVTFEVPAVDQSIPNLSALPEEMQNISLAEALELGHLQMPDPQFSSKFSQFVKSLPGTITLRQLAELAKRFPVERTAPPMVIVTFAPDGKTVLTGSWDQTARIWSAEGGAPLQSFPVGSGLFTSASFSPDGKSLLTTSTTGRAPESIAYLRNLKGEEIARFAGHEKSLRSSAISPDGKWIVTGSADRTARLWRIEGGDAVQTFAGQRDAIAGVDFSPDGKRLLTGSADGSVWLWEIGKASPLQVWRAHEDDVKSVTFLSSGELFVTSSRDGTAKVWRIGSPVPVQTFHHRAALFQADVSPDGKRVLTGGTDQNAKLWAVDEIAFSSAAEKVRLSCERLKAIGATAFTGADRQRYAMLEGTAENLCE